MKQATRLHLFGMVGLVLLAVAVTAAPAEESDNFNNPAGISRAQKILVSTGHLAAGSYSQGVLDEATRKALSEYQSEHALEHAGDLDNDTYQMLLSHTASYPWGNGDSLSVAASSPVQPSHSGSSRVARAPSLAEAQQPSATAHEATGDEGSEDMPGTASNLPILAGVGLLLLGIGFVLLRFRKA